MTYPNRRSLLMMGAAAAMTGWSSSAACAQGVAIPAMPPIEAYAGSPFVDEISISPDGSHFAIVSQKGDNKVLVHFSIADPTPRTVVLGKVKIRGLMFGDNDHVVISHTLTADSAYSTARHEYLLASIVELKTGTVRGLFRGWQGETTPFSGGLGRIKLDSEYCVTGFTYNYDRGLSSYYLHAVSMAGKYSGVIFEGSGNTDGWVVTPDGHPQAYSTFDDDKKLWSLYYNQSPKGQSPEFKAVYRATSALHHPALLGLGRDGKSVVILLRPEDGNDDYHEVAGDGVLGPPLDPGGAGTDRDALFHPTTGCLAGFSRTTDEGTVYDYFDPMMKTLATALKATMGEAYRASIVECAEDPRRMIAYGESRDDAGSYFFVDFSTGDVVSLAGAWPGIPAAWISQKTPVIYAAGDGLPIHAYLTMPVLPAGGTAKNLPLIVLPHGGPQARDHIGFDWQAQLLASRGYAVLQPNFRGSSGYGLDFVRKGHGEWGRKMQTDLSDGVRWLTAQEIVDPKRVAILGASYGGYAALAGATLDRDVYRCAISIAGISDLEAMMSFESGHGYDMNANNVLYWSQFLGDKSGWAAVSPARQAARAYCPILLIHGTDDTVVPIDQSRRMEKALKAAGKSVELVTYKGQDHWETIGSARVEMMTATLAFLDKHNPAG